MSEEVKNANIYKTERGVEKDSRIHFELQSTFKHLQLPNLLSHPIKFFLEKKTQYFSF